MSEKNKIRNMGSTFKIIGFFSTSLEGERITGELDYISGKISLKINGSFAKGLTGVLVPIEFDIIYGWTHQNELITLRNLNNISSILSSKFVSETYLAEQLFIGAHINSNSKFNSMNFNHELLEEWLEIYPFDGLSN